MPTEDVGFFNPIAFGITLLMGLLLLFLPRRYALVPVILHVCTIPMFPSLMIGGLHFRMLRILVIFGLARIVVRGEVRALKLNQIDKAFAWWALSAAVMHALLWRESREILWCVGNVGDELGFYFLFRCLVRELDDVVRAFKIIAILAVPVALAMVFEGVTLKNPFVAFGAEGKIPEIRHVLARARGAFANPILAGSYGGAILPFFFALWPESRLLALLGIFSSSVITVASGASGPLMTYGASILGLCMWVFRKKMRAIRWGIVLMLVGLECVMKAHVWWIIGHIEIIPGSGAYHRAVLIDQAIRHFPEWFLVGTKDTEAWGYYLHDITNQFVWEGVQGGLLQLILFVTIIVLCFRAVGRTLPAMQNQPFAQRFCVWALGAALFSDVITFFGVPYYDQNFVKWNLLLAMISSVSTSFVSTKGKTWARVTPFRDDTESPCPVPVAAEHQRV